VNRRPSEKNGGEVLSPVNRPAAVVSSFQAPSEEEIQMRLRIAQWDHAEREISLKRTPVEIQNGEAILHVQLVSKSACFPGDANAIEMELKASPGHKLMVTLEKMGEGASSATWDVPSDFLEREEAHSILTLPVEKRPAQYGFYLCTAKREDTSCKGKRVQDLNLVFSEHVRKMPGAGKEPRTIFFQYFLLDDRGLAAFSQAKNNDQQFQNLKLYAKERSVDAIDLNREIDSVKENMATLASLPFVFDGKSITIELPKYDVKSCGK